LVTQNVNLAHVLDILTTFVYYKLVNISKVLLKTDFILHSWLLDYYHFILGFVEVQLDKLPNFVQMGLVILEVACPVDSKRHCHGSVIKSTVIDVIELWYWCVFALYFPGWKLILQILMLTLKNL